MVLNNTAIDNLGLYKKYNIYKTQIELGDIVVNQDGESMQDSRLDKKFVGLYTFVEIEPEPKAYVFENKNHTYKIPFNELGYYQFSYVSSGGGRKKTQRKRKRKMKTNNKTKRRKTQKKKTKRRKRH